MDIYDTLFKYYSVDTVEALVDAQRKHIIKLQQRVLKYRDLKDN